MSTRKSIAYDSRLNVNDFADPITYVKYVLDSIPHSDKEGFRASGRQLLVGRYLTLGETKKFKEQKLIAKAITELLSDPDYSSDAIPVAAELGLTEAKEWFLNLSKKPLEQIRNIKTNDFVNGLICLVKFAGKFNNFTPYLRTLSGGKVLTVGERSIVLYCLSDSDPDFILEAVDKYLTALLPAKQNEQDKLTYIIFLTSGIFKKYGDGYCIDLAKRFKEKLPEEYQILFYKALEQNPTPRFKPYLEELKKILEINE